MRNSVSVAFFSLMSTLLIFGTVIMGSSELVQMCIRDRCYAGLMITKWLSTSKTKTNTAAFGKSAAGRPAHAWYLCSSAYFRGNQAFPAG